MRTLFILLVTTTGLSQADTVKTTSNVSCNGRITALDSAHLLMTARFLGDTREIEIDRGAIKSIEFNQNDFNSLPARGPFYARTPQRSPRSEARSKEETTPVGARDIIYFIGGERIEAEVLAVDATYVRVSGDRSYRRVLLHSIRFASR
jgi:hypothetical protein